MGGRGTFGGHFGHFGGTFLTFGGLFGHGSQLNTELTRGWYNYISNDVPKTSSIGIVGFQKNLEVLPIPLERTFWTQLIHYANLWKSYNHPFYISVAHPRSPFSEMSTTWCCPQHMYKKGLKVTVLRFLGLVGVYVLAKPAKRSLETQKWAPPQQVDIDWTKQTNFEKKESQQIWPPPSSTKHYDKTFTFKSRRVHPFKSTSSSIFLTISVSFSIFPCFFHEKVKKTTFNQE